MPGWSRLSFTAAGHARGEGKVLAGDVRVRDLARAGGRDGDIEAGLVEGIDHALVLEERQLFRADQAVDRGQRRREPIDHLAADCDHDTHEQDERERDGEQAARVGSQVTASIR